MALDPNFSTTASSRPISPLSQTHVPIGGPNPQINKPSPLQHDPSSHSHSHSHPLIYPVSSLGRGFISKAKGVRPIISSTVPSSSLYSHHGVGVGVGAHLDYLTHSLHMNTTTSTGPPSLQQHYPLHLGLGPTLPPAASPPIKGLPLDVSPQPHPKGASRSAISDSNGYRDTTSAREGSRNDIGYPMRDRKGASRSTVSDSNGYKDTSTREKNRDDACYIIRDRKVRITEDASLYALCRSWLRNGVNEENQPQQKDVMKALPKPLRASMVASYMSSKKEDEEEDNELKENEESAEHLSPQDLLRRHIKRAKKVRARLREERLQRITRYRSRLRLLLPPPVEQFRNDTAAGN